MDEEIEVKENLLGDNDKLPLFVSKLDPKRMLHLRRKMKSVFVSKLDPKRKLHLRRKMKSVLHILTFMSMFKEIKTIQKGNRLKKRLK